MRQFSKNGIKTFLRVLAVSVLFFTCITAAYAEVSYTFQVPVPGLSETIQLCEANQALLSCGGIIKYIVAVYEWIIKLAVILSALIVTIAGFRWMFARGNTGTITEARKMISNTFIGLVLALGSYTLLWAINPKLVTFGPLNLSRIKEKRLIIDDGCDRDKLKRSAGISINTFTHITFDDSTKADIETPNMVVQALVTAMKNIDTGGFNIKASVPSDRNSSHLGVHTAPITALDFAGTAEELEKFKKYINDNKILLTNGSTYLWDDGKYLHFDIDCKSVLQAEE